jgi:ubiquitin carboxyl-terminal hydrolase 4/11/15
MSAALPSEEYQCQTVFELQKSTGLVVGEKAYLLSEKWWTQWKRSVGYPHGSPQRTEVPPIDNQHLMDKGELRSDISEMNDYSIVTGPVWSQLYSWYGGGPVISRTIALNPITGKPQVLVTFPKYEIFFRDQRRPFPFSPFRAVGELKLEACQAFSCDPSRARLCDFDFRERGIV